MAAEAKTAMVPETSKFTEIKKLLWEVAADADEIQFYSLELQTSYEKLVKSVRYLHAAHLDNDIEGFSTRVEREMKALKKLLDKIPLDGKLGEIVAKLEYALALSRLHFTECHVCETCKKTSIEKNICYMQSSIMNGMCFAVQLVRSRHLLQSPV